MGQDFYNLKTLALYTVLNLKSLDAEKIRKKHPKNHNSAEGINLQNVNERQVGTLRSHGWLWHS